MLKRVLRWLLSLLLLSLLIPTAFASDHTKLIALTFDDGPSPYTDELLDGLAKRDAHATFFVQGVKSRRYADEIRRIVAEGHQLANHSYDHPDLSTLPLEEALEQLTQTDNILNDITGGTGAYSYRAPYGRCTTQMRAELEAPLYYWNIDCQDWVDGSPAAIAELLLTQVQDGYNVLLHDTVRGSVTATLQVIDILKEQGYEFVTLKELFHRRGVEQISGGIYYSCLPNGTQKDALRTPFLDAQGTAEELTVSLESYDGADIYYSTDGSDLLQDAALYTGPFQVKLPCTIRAVAAWDLNGGRSAELCVTYREPPADRPVVKINNGKVAVSLGKTGSDLYYRTDREPLSHVVYQPEGSVQLPVRPGMWFHCYVDGKELATSETVSLLYTPRGNLFSDMAVSDTHFEALDWAVSKGYMACTDHRYAVHPDAVVTRSMLADCLCRYSGERASARKLPFDDITLSHPDAASITWACERGLMSAYKEDLFCPDEVVTRQDLAKVLATLLGSGQPKVQLEYVDRYQIAPWAMRSVQTVTALDLMHGSGAYFDPWGTVTRGEFAEILQRLFVIQSK